MLKGIVTKRNIEGYSGILFCGRRLDEENYNCCCGFKMKTSLKVVAAYLMVVTLQIVLVVGAFELTYECLEEDNVDCFRRRYGTDIELFPTESPLNCSLTPISQSVFCYRSVILDPENWFKTFTAAYILVRMLRFVLYLVSALFMMSGDKNKNLQMACRVVICFFSGVAMALVIFLSVFHETSFEYASRQVSLSEVMQIVSIMFLPLLFALVIPWSDFAGEPEFFVNASDLMDQAAEAAGTVLQNRGITP